MRRTHAMVLYFSRTGVKCYNPPLSSELFGYASSGQLETVSPDQLYLWIDHLKDSYTFIGFHVCDSAQFNLMETFLRGEDIAQSWYMKRRAMGALDFAPPIRVDKEFLQRTKMYLTETSKQMRLGNYEPIKIVRADGKPYIADGKHRAAMCAAMGLAAKCIDVTPVMYDSFFWWVYRRMLHRQHDFRKHIVFFETLFESDMRVEPTGR